MSMFPEKLLAFGADGAIAERSAFGGAGHNSDMFGQIEALLLDYASRAQFSVESITALINTVRSPSDRERVVTGPLKTLLFD
jgi:hypothetical protein